MCMLAAGKVGSGHICSCTVLVMFFKDDFCCMRRTQIQVFVCVCVLIKLKPSIIEGIITLKLQFFHQKKIDIYFLLQFLDDQ